MKIGKDGKLKLSKVERQIGNFIIAILNQENRIGHGG